MNSNKHPIALQLYSLRDLAQQDFVRTLELTAELGYEGVEFAGYGGLSSSEMKDHLDRLNLRAVSTHVSLERLRDHLDEEIAYNRVLGNSTLVCPAPPRGFERTRENWTALGKELTELGKRLLTRGSAWATITTASNLSSMKASMPWTCSGRPLTRFSSCPAGPGLGAARRTLRLLRSWQDVHPRSYQGF